MKIHPSDRTPLTGPDGHLIRELVGMTSMNVSKYSVAHIVVPAGSKGITRQNQFDELIIVIKGHGVARQDYVSDEIGPNDVVLLPTGTQYAIDAKGEEDLELWAICVPAYRQEWSTLGANKRNWRDYEVPRGSERLREIRNRQTK
jgi:mannose-6-phosphate isomerase-like protein (cupin superfamily)